MSLEELLNISGEELQSMLDNFLRSESTMQDLYNAADQGEWSYQALVFVLKFLCADAGANKIKVGYVTEEEQQEIMYLRVDQPNAGVIILDRGSFRFEK